MAEQVKQQGMDGQDKLFSRDAVDISRSLNAHIGIVAYGKAFLFYQGLLEDMEKKSGMTIELGHLVELCREEGKEVDLCHNRCMVSLTAVDVTEEQWLKELEEIGNGSDGGTEDEEMEDDV